MQKILLVDDDQALCDMLVEYLNGEGFSVDAVHDGERGVQAALNGDHGLIILDIMMPKLNGLEVLRQIRHRSNVPVLMLTAKGDEVDRIVGLEIGADDYMSKPFHPRELVARLRAILRRLSSATSVQQENEIQHDRLVLNLGARTASWAGEPLNLTSTEFNLLSVLVAQAGQVVSKGELSQMALGKKLERYDRGIDMHISHLRQKLGRLEDGRSPIETIRGSGYQWIKS